MQKRKRTKNLIKRGAAALNLFLLIGLCACAAGTSPSQAGPPPGETFPPGGAEESARETDQSTPNTEETEEMETKNNNYDALFEGLTLTKSYKKANQANNL